MEDEIVGAFVKFVVIPIFFVLGLLVVGSIIEQALGLPDITKWLFVGGGGIIALLAYFRNSLFS